MAEKNPRGHYNDEGGESSGKVGIKEASGKTGVGGAGRAGGARSCKRSLGAEGEGRGPRPPRGKRPGPGITQSGLRGEWRVGKWVGVWPLSRALGDQILFP